MKIKSKKSLCRNVKRKRRRTKERGEDKLFHHRRVNFPSLLSNLFILWSCSSYSCTRCHSKHFVTKISQLVKILYLRIRHQCCHHLVLYKHTLFFYHSPLLQQYIATDVVYTVNSLVFNIRSFFFMNNPCCWIVVVHQTSNSHTS